MSYKRMKCLSCGRRIVKPTLDKGKGYCNDCIKKTNALLRTLDKMIPYEYGARTMRRTCKLVVRTKTYSNNKNYNNKLR